jgi:hypothetical protein
LGDSQLEVSVLMGSRLVHDIMLVLSEVEDAQGAQPNGARNRNRLCFNFHTSHFTPHTSEAQRRLP